MKRAVPRNPGRVALLFTRYPVVSETFLQREVAAMKEIGLEFDVFSLWPPPGKADCQIPANQTFKPWQLIALFWWIPFWLVRNPRALCRLPSILVETRPSDATNAWETLLGLGYAVIHARKFEGTFNHTHAVWASAPATAAWAISELTGISYSMSGHAYDLFENGGDGLLKAKIPNARFLRTSTDVGRKRWLQFGANPEQVHTVRRGLLEFPDLPELDKPPKRHLLAVGRLVEKMGFELFLEIISELRQRGLDFEGTIVGGGPLALNLQRQAEILGISDSVTFTGVQPYQEVERFYRQGGVLVFSGKIDQKGDRAGFPNVIGEAMAWGLPVCATPVGAVEEGIHDGKTGMIFRTAAEAADHITDLYASPDSYRSIRIGAREWVEEHFDTKRNMLVFKELIENSS